MRGKWILIAGIALVLTLAAGPIMAQEKSKEKPMKASGDVGLLDTEKNYMILVTKEGKLITADFSDQTKVTKLVPEKVKVGDMDLGQAATVTYIEKDGKNIAVSVDYTVKAKKGQ